MTTGPFDPTAPENVITPAEAAAQVAAGRVDLIDVREDGEWDAGHAEQARHIASGALDPAALDQQRVIVTVCRSGKRSARAADQLRSAGFVVRDLAGGMQAWDAAGLPVVRGDGTRGSVA